MFVSFFQEFGYPEEYSRETFLVATRELNFYKGVKVLCFDNAFRITAEMFVRNAEAVKTVFYRLREIIEDLRSDVLDECKKASLISSTNSSSSGLPFVVTDIEIANVDYDGNIIQGYGASIYEYATRYLKPRITVDVISGSGNKKYTLYAKLYKDGVLQRNSNVSPENYTFSNDVTIGSDKKRIELSGWGANTAGQWKSGNYRYEIWCNGNCIGTKDFRVIK